MIQKRPTGDQVSSLCRKSVKDLEDILRKQIKSQVDFLDEKIAGVDVGFKEELKYLRELGQEADDKMKRANADIERNQNQINKLRDDLDSRPAPKADINLADIEPLLESLRQDLKTELGESQETQETQISQIQSRINQLQAQLDSRQAH